MRCADSSAELKKPRECVEDGVEEYGCWFSQWAVYLSELKLEYMKAHRNAYGERMTEAQEQRFVVGEAFGSYFRL
tara:strand:+ start:404 stop:628 length:225 start_codon:yes stop_codon:yes gene_type:complete